MFSVAASALLALSIGCGDDPVDEPDPPDELSTLEKAVAFLGGADALQATVGVRYEIAGTRSTDSESFEVGAPAQQVGSFEATVSHDLAGDGLRFDYVRTSLFLGGAQFTFSEIIDGQLGFVAGVDGLFGFGDYPMLSTRWAAIRKQHDLVHPYQLIARALADESIATEAGEETIDGRTFEILEIADPVAPIQLSVDAETGEIARAVTGANELLHRDVTLEITYRDWQSAGALRFPNAVAISQDGQEIHTETRSAIELDPAFETGTFEIPAGATPEFVADDAAFGELNHLFFQEFFALGIPLDARQETVVLTEVVPGVHFVTGGSHNSLVVEQENGLVVVEAPNYPERSDAILAELAVQFPGVPVTHVIATHHHYDHTAGLRSFVAAGATVVTHALGQPLYEAVFAAPSTISPDRLSAEPTAATFETVDAANSLLLDDANLPIEIFNLPNGHAEDTVLIVVGAVEPVAFESDLYNPGNGGQAINPAFAAELLTALQAVGFNAGFIAGGHGAIAPLGELEAFVAAN